MKKSPTISYGTAISPWLLGLAAGITLAAPAYADAESDGIEVIARLDDPASDATSSTLSLLRSDLEAQAPITMLESLAILPGIDAFEKGGAGGGSYLALRGGEPNFALVVINGVRVNDPMLSSGGGFDFSQIGPGDISGVDVLSGPWSTTYGADALSGVVSIRLDPPREGTGVSGRMGTGTDGRFEVGGRLFSSGRAGSLVVAASASDTGDFLAGSTSARQSAMIAASPEIGGVFTLDLFGFYGASQGEGFPEDSGGPVLAVIRGPETRNREQLAAGATASIALSEAIEGQMRISWGRSTFRSASPGIAEGVLDAVPPLTSDSRFDRVEVVTTLGWKPSPSIQTSVGASVVHEDGQSNGAIDYGVLIPTAYKLSRTLPSLFTTASLTLPNAISVDLGLRADFLKNGGTRVTPHAGLAVPLGETGLRLTASYAQGFKQPSFFALGFPLLANPDLLTEKSETYDGGVAWSSPDEVWRTSVKAYRSIYRDLIDFDPDQFTNVNRSKVTAEGFELAASGNLSRLRVLTSLTYLVAKSADDAPLRYRPKWKGAAALEYSVSDALTFRIDGRFSNSWLDSSVPTGFVQQEGFATLDAQFAVHLRPGLELRASLRNLTDTHYERTIGTPEPGRNVFFSLIGSI